MNQEEDEEEDILEYPTHTHLSRSDSKPLEASAHGMNDEKEEHVSKPSKHARGRCSAS